MRTMIAYATKTGTAERCALALAEKIPGSTLVDLRKEKPDPAAYDQVIVGGSVRAAALHAAARQYLNGAKQALMGKRLGIYLCAGGDDSAQKVMQTNIDPELRAHALSVACFGGDMNPENFRGIERFIVRMALKAAKSDRDDLPRLRPERIEQFAALFAGE